MSKGHLTHSVFFTLKDASEAKIQQLVDDCYELLGTAEGLISLHAGTRIPDLEREVNDTDFHVALIVIFENRAAHDAYQTMECHVSFIERNKENWAKARIFDATS